MCEVFNFLKKLIPREDVRLLVDAFCADDAAAVLMSIERLARTYLLAARVTGETLLVVVLVLEHQIALIGQDQAHAFAALFGLLLRVAINTEGILLRVAVDTLADELFGTHVTNEAVFMVFATLERDQIARYWLVTLAAFT